MNPELLLNPEFLLLVFVPLVSFWLGALVGYRHHPAKTLKPVVLPQPKPEAPPPPPPGPNRYIFRRRLFAEFVDNPDDREPWTIYEVSEKDARLKVRNLFHTDAANVEALLDWIENR